MSSLFSLPSSVHPRTTLSTPPHHHPTSSKPPYPPAFASTKAAQPSSSAPSAYPAFLKGTAHRSQISHSSAANANKRIPNAAWVRSTTVGDLEVEVDYRERRRTRPALSDALDAQESQEFQSITPKRARFDLSKVQFTKVSTQSQALGLATPSSSKSRSKQTLAVARVAPFCSSSRNSSSRSSSPEVPLAASRATPKRPSSTSLSPSAPVENPYPSPTLSLSPLDITTEIHPLCHDLFHDAEGQPLRFFLDDASHARFAASVLVRPRPDCSPLTRRTMAVS